MMVQSQTPANQMHWLPLDVTIPNKAFYVCNDNTMSNVNIPDNDKDAVSRKSTWKSHIIAY